jgi:hypothetical protein
MSKSEVFLSYSHLDKEFALKLAGQLRRQGSHIWVDRLDISPGDIWDIEVEKALQRCEYLLFVISQAAVSSSDVLNEVYYALEAGKKVLPVKIDKCETPFRVKRLHYTDFSENYDEGLDILIKAFKRYGLVDIPHASSFEKEEPQPVPEEKPGKSPGLKIKSAIFSLKQYFGPNKLAVNRQGTFVQEKVVFDKINIYKGFRIEAKVKSYQSGGSTRFGLSWNFISPEDFFLFTLHNDDNDVNHSMYSIGRGNTLTKNEKSWSRYSISDLNINGNTYNTLSIEKQGNILDFYVNTERVWNTSQYSIISNTFAFWIADFGMVECESLKAFQ